MADDDCHELSRRLRSGNPERRTHDHRGGHVHYGFVGRAPFGPVCPPVLISSFGDYQRQFGGLSLNSTMSYAVNDFFQNGGSQAVIVRLYLPPNGEFGERLGDYYERYVETEAHALGLTLEALRTWRPEARTRKGRARKNAG